MALCKDHRRLVVGGCMLCGKELCDRCVMRQEGVKVWCSSCFRRDQFMPQKRFALEEIKPRPASQKKVDLPKQGYFDFSKLMKR